MDCDYSGSQFQVIKLELEASLVQSEMYLHAGDNTSQSAQCLRGYIFVCNLEGRQGDF